MTQYNFQVCMKYDAANLMLFLYARHEHNHFVFSSCYILASIDILKRGSAGIVSSIVNGVHICYGTQSMSVFVVFASGHASGKCLRRFLSHLRNLAK